MVFLCVALAARSSVGKSTAAGEDKYLADSKACTKCHPNNDGGTHLPRFNQWRDLSASHSQAKPDEKGTTQQQFRASTGFVGKGDWLEDGVGCEACHGPNLDHSKAKNKEEGIKTTFAGKVARLEDANAMTADTKPFKDEDIPKTLKAAQTCGACHGAWKAKSGEDYPKGFEIKPDGSHDITKVADPAPAGDSLKTRQFGEWLTKDPSGKEKRHADVGVWCGTCHDPHAVNTDSAGLRTIKDPKTGKRLSGVNALCAYCHKKEADIAKHLADPTQKHVPGIKITPDMACIPCHMPNHSHVISNEEAMKYEMDNKEKLTK
jgi:hypothetical protein